MSFSLTDPVFNSSLFFILSQIWAALFWAVFYLWSQMCLDRDSKSSSIICIQLPSRIHSFSSGNKQHVMYTCNSYEENEKQKQLQCTAMFSWIQNQNIHNYNDFFYQVIQPFHDGDRYHIETSPLICGANQWTGFYMITISVMKGLITLHLEIQNRCLLVTKALFMWMSGVIVSDSLFWSCLYF